MNESSIKLLSGKIAQALGAPEAEVLRFIERGDMRIQGEPVPGFKPIMDTSDGQIIVANAQVRYRYLEYADLLARVRQERKAGRNNFFHVLSKLRAVAADDKKATLMEPQEIYGHKTVMRPYMGYSLRMRHDMAIPFHHFVLQHILAEHMHADLDVVFEIGAGIGDTIAELAARNPFRHIDFLAGEIALNGQRCAAEFADTLRLRNLRAVDFDITAPNFGFLKGKKNALVFSQGALIYANPFPEQFFRRLTDSVEHVTVLLFELCSFAFADEFKITPGFTREQAKSYGIAENLWNCIKAAELDGHIVIDEVIPDVAGKTSANAASLIRFHKK